MKNLIFLISLPRSGSTLLQKMLTVSPEIHSVSEPWLMLPLAFMLQKEGTLTTYSHGTAAYAVEDFIKELPNGHKDFCATLEDFATSLYSKTQHGGSARYFLDKTPRYYLIVPFLAEVFPNAKFIFLFRNPLEVLSSILTTWLNDRLIIFNHYIDVFQGPCALSRGYNLLKDRSIAVSYGDLVRSPESELQRICSYLEISYEPSMVLSYKNIEFKGRMGDPKDIHEFKNVSINSMGKWKTTLNTHYRKWYAKRYVRFLGDKVLKDFGSSVKELTREIDSITQTRRGSFKDAFYHFFSNTMRIVNGFHYKRPFWSSIFRKRFYPYM